MFKFILILAMVFPDDSIKEVPVAVVENKELCTTLAQQLNDHPARGGVQYLYCQEVVKV